MTVTDTLTNSYADTTDWQGLESRAISRRRTLTSSKAALGRGSSSQDLRIPPCPSVGLLHTGRDRHPLLAGGFAFPASVPAEAVIVNQNRATHVLPVHAWADGDALVLWRGQMRRAQNLDGFKEVRDRREIVGVVPGGGWMIEFRDKDEGTAFADPVVAWAIYSDGTAEPVDTDSEGVAMTLSSSGGDRRIYHPDQITDIKLTAEADPTGDGE